MKEKKQFYLSLVFPVLFLFLIWFVKFIEFGLETDFVQLGIYPLKSKGLIGIITAPFIHADINHLFDNSIPVFFLSLALFYFYREVAYRVFIFSWISTGILVWFVGREAYHIGASGLIYSLAAFLLVSGILKKNRNLLAISLLVIFLYGSMVWGLLPYDYKISWESHLMGAITGVFLAILYRHKGPEPDLNIIPEDFEEEETEDYSLAEPEESDIIKKLENREP